MKKWALRWIAASAIVAGLIIGAIYLVYSLSHESTDDAWMIIVYWFSSLLLDRRADSLEGGGHGDVRAR